MSHITRRALSIGAIFILGLTLTVSAERAWVTNRDLATVTVFDTVALTEEAGSPVTVGAGPIDIASDSSDAAGPQQIFVVNSGSNTVSQLGVAPVGGAATFFGGGLYGNFAVPSGIVRVPFSNGETFMAITDQKVTTGVSGTGRSTIRFMNALTHVIEDDFRDPSASARYNDVVWANDRLWIADDGDGGVVVVSIPGPPYFYLPDTLVFQGTSDFADFIYDSAATPAFLVAPRRLATNGSVVIAVDGSSSNVTILDANYAFNNETSAVLMNVALPPGSGNGIDVEIVGGFAYVSSTGAPSLHQINLATFAVVSNVLAPGAGSHGIGATFDGTTLYVGAGPGSPTINLYTIAAWPGGPAPSAFAGGFPFAFYVSPVASISTPPPGGGGTWVSTGGLAPGEGGSSKSQCGLLGLEALLALLALRLARGRPA